MMGVMIQTAFLVAAILAVQKIFGERLHVYVRYGLWLLVAFRLLVPVNLVDSPLSMLRVAAVWEQYESALQPDRIASQSEELLSVEEDSVYGKDHTYGGNIIKKNDAAQAGETMAAEEDNAYNRDHAHGGDTGGENDAEQADRSLQSSSTGSSGIDSIWIEDADKTENVETTGEKLVEEEAIGRGATDGRELDKSRGAARGGSLIGSIVRIVNTPLLQTGARVLWMAGSLFVGGFFAASHLRFCRRLHRKRVACYGNCLRTIYGTYGTAPRRPVPVYRVKGLESPCLAGLFRPAVYIGADIDTDSDTFRYAVIHEEVHFYHKDHIWALVRAVLVSVYWFHPLVWVAASASARDGELACDYGTIRRIGQGERFAYSEMLLAFARAGKSGRVYSYGAMLRPGQSEIKKRILRLTGAKGSKLWAGVLAAVWMAVLSGCALTGAAKDAGENIENTIPADLASEETGNLANGEEAGQGGSPAQAEDESQSGKSDGQGGEDGGFQDETLAEPRQIEAVAADISVETLLGADGPTLDFAGNFGKGEESAMQKSVIIFHDYFGLVVYDLTDGRMMRSLDLAQIGCHMTQGDDACQVAVSADGTTVWMHPRSKPYLYRYEVQDDLLYQEPLVKTFEIDLEGRELFERYMTTEETYVGWRSNYLYEEYQDGGEKYRIYIYLYASNDPLKLRNLQCVWDDMVYVLFGENFVENENASGGQETEKGAFPYRYEDGTGQAATVDMVVIYYDKPCDYSRISAVFEGRVHPVTQELVMHEGIDFVAEAGTDIVAAADGVVYETGYSAEYGNYVVLLHVNGEMTYYCHCQKVTVEKDAQVKRGEKIATVGNTGRSTGAHLHFALSRNGMFVNPEESMRNVVGLEGALEFTAKK